MAHLFVRQDGPSPTKNESVATNSTGSSDQDFATMFPFSAGATGVDQTTNFLAVDILAGLLIAAGFLVLCLRWMKIFTAHLRQVSAMANLEGQRYWKYNGSSWMPQLKRHLLFAPLWKKRHNEELLFSSVVSMGTLPGRAHFLLLVAWTAFNLGWLLTLPYDESQVALLAAVRGRAGMMAVFNLFPTIAFALRNNPLIWALQVPFDTFQLFHRWCARIFIIESIIHVAAWVTDTRLVGGWDAVGLGFTSGQHSASFDWGLVAVVTATLIFFQAWSPVRHAFYEAFLFMHKFFVFFTFVGILLHLRIDNLPYESWMYAIIGLWGLDYVARAVRIIIYNFNFKDRKWSSDVVIEALDGDCSRITVRLPTYWRPRPGAHVQMYIPQFGIFEAHPFSVAWAEVEEISVSPNLDAKLPLTSREITEELDYEPVRRTTISLLVRARTGFTGHIHKRVSDMPSSICQTWGWLEGFYGGHDPLSSYSDVLLFAGGVGITHQIMFCKQLLEGYRDGTVAARRIMLIWSCPNKPCLDWVRAWMNDILTMEHRRECLKILLFITRQKNPESYLSNSRSVQMVNGRCNPQEIIDTAITERSGAMAVTVCGPGAFADEVRDAVRKRVNIGCLDFIEEAFTY